MQTLEQETASSVNWKLEGSFLLNDDLRSEALSILDSTPFPTTKNEEWKYTRVGKIKNAPLAIQSGNEPDEIKSIEENTLKLVFVNGHFSKKLSATAFPDGIKILPFSNMDAVERQVLGTQTGADRNDIFAAFNTAYTTDGLYIHISAKMVIEPTIEIIQITSGDHVLSNVRHVVMAEAFSEARFIQRFVTLGGETGFTNHISEINLGKNARIVWDKLQEETDTQLQVSQEFVKQAQDSNFTINTITLNGALVRNNLWIEVNGENCETHLNGAYILKDNQHVDNHTVVDHKVAHCESNELYKGVIDGKGTAVFNGKVFVRKDAQKINAFQSNANVLLSTDASVNSKPELEIYADDVKCSHGSTTGQLDEEAVFYLRARGISEASARQLMVVAFIEDVLLKIENESVVNHIHEILKQRFDWTI